MELIRKLKKHKAIKSYIKRLPRLLVINYGKTKDYTPGQIKYTIERNNLSKCFMSYAIAMYSSKANFIHFYSETSEECNYEAARDYIVDHFLGGSDNSTCSNGSMHDFTMDSDIGDSYWDGDGD